MGGGGGRWGVRSQASGSAVLECDPGTEVTTGGGGTQALGWGRERMALGGWVGDGGP